MPMSHTQIIQHATLLTMQNGRGYVLRHDGASNGDAAKPTWAISPNKLKCRTGSLPTCMASDGCEVCCARISRLFLPDQSVPAQVGSGGEVVQDAATIVKDSDDAKLDLVGGDSGRNAIVKFDVGRAVARYL